ncbi:deoxyribodipyrimidine photo-lyase [Cognatiyoonia koreensis]|uniref:Deoxyribodipyrimidine photo-lyase n=1 Tax=Cognatiyoonia koreensis TaxID=364200 RepID=A0A1I0Q137_9RHOB|nr:FAD-binding domain-containing protein [Cognatiyoonia koreensis]SEW20512.1 deoxyribodipyrimidine photo-lyase [Cognatiyoonia koreensis]
MSEFQPTRDAGLSRLQDFLPQAGFNYTKKRNFDLPGHAEVSRLSPYLRHRIITEEEVLKAVLKQHSANQAEKFIAEVCWRTYWKGVLQLRPSLWTMYQADLNAAWNLVQTNGGLRADWEAACKGETGIACFDHWAHELAETGYLHNHARMWFASIWIFTLRLPWVLGADFFLRHLLDGDPASNTLSWRWVGGLQTKGKTYLARPDNIEKYTGGRFKPEGLADVAVPLDGPELPPTGPVPTGDVIPTNGKIGTLVTDEDLSADPAFANADCCAILRPQTRFGPLQTASHVVTFKGACLDDFADRCDVPITHVNDVDGILSWAADAGLDCVVMWIAPTGPTADKLRDLRSRLAENGMSLSVQIRPYDNLAWPRATHGFFRFKDVIPKLLAGVS